MIQPFTASHMAGHGGNSTIDDHSPGGLSAGRAAVLDAATVLVMLDAADTGLTAGEVINRRKAAGPNEVAQSRTTVAAIVLGQLRSPLLVLLFVTAALSAVVGEPTNAIIILAILCASVTLGGGQRLPRNRRSRRARGQCAPAGPGPPGRSLGTCGCPRSRPR